MPVSRVASAVVGRDDHGAARQRTARVALLLLAASVGCQSAPRAAAPKPAAPSAPPPLVFTPGQEQSLFDGKELGLWKVLSLGEGERVAVEDGELRLASRFPGAAVVWGGPELRVGYELRLALRRGAGGAGSYAFLDVPVGPETCTLTFASWLVVRCPSSRPGGAADPAFARTTELAIEPDRWYALRVSVAAGRIGIDVDGRKLVDVEVPAARSGPEAAAGAAEPLRIATWSTDAAVRDLRMTRLAE